MQFKLKKKKKCFKIPHFWPDNRRGRTNTEASISCQTAQRHDVEALLPVCHVDPATHSPNHDVVEVCCNVNGYSNYWSPLQCYGHKCSAEKPPTQHEPTMASPTTRHNLSTTTSSVIGHRLLCILPGLPLQVKRQLIVGKKKLVEMLEG